MKIIDLHTHSTASDGTDKPEELIQKAFTAGISALALTDHDTFSGLEKAKKEAEKYNIEFIHGIEISADHPIGEIHILGYWFHEDPSENLGLKKLLDKFLAFREERNVQLLKNLKKVGIELTSEDFSEFLGTEKMLCRPHIALALVKKNIVQNLHEAFAKYLGNNGIAYVPKEKLPPEEVVKGLKENNALVSLAHPYLITCHRENEREKIIKNLANSGLDALEAHYSLHSQNNTNTLLSYCHKYTLKATGGSDYHGKVKPNIILGKGLGNLHVDYSVLESLKGL